MELVGGRLRRRRIGGTASRGLLARKIAPRHAQRARQPAMSLDQAHAAIRAGMEIADSLAGNVMACAGVGVGSHESAALVLARAVGANRFATS